MSKVDVNVKLLKNYRSGKDWTVSDPSSCQTICTAKGTTVIVNFSTNKCVAQTMLGWKDVPLEMPLPTSKEIKFGPYLIRPSYSQAAILWVNSKGYLCTLEGFQENDTFSWGTASTTSLLSDEELCICSYPYNVSFNAPTVVVTCYRVGAQGLASSTIYLAPLLETNTDGSKFTLASGVALKTKLKVTLLGSSVKNLKFFHNENSTTSCLIAAAAMTYESFRFTGRTELTSYNFWPNQQNVMSYQWSMGMGDRFKGWRVMTLSQIFYTMDGLSRTYITITLPVPALKTLQLTDVMSFQLFGEERNIFVLKTELNAYLYFYGYPNPAERVSKYLVSNSSTSSYFLQEIVPESRISKYACFFINERNQVCVTMSNETFWAPPFVTGYYAKAIYPRRDDPAQLGALVVQLDNSVVLIGKNLDPKFLCWHDERVFLDIPQSLSTFSTYHIEVAILDNLLRKVPMTEFKIKVSDREMLKVNQNCVCFQGPNEEKTVVSDEKGVVLIEQEVFSVVTPTITMTFFDPVSLTSTKFEINPIKSLQARIKEDTKDDATLGTIKIGEDGAQEDLIPRKNLSKVASVSKTIRMALLQNLSYHPDDAILTRNSICARIMHSSSSEQEHERLKFDDSVDWAIHIGKDSKGTGYLDVADVERRIEELSVGASSWFSDAVDFFVAVINVVVKVADVIITSIAGQVKAFIKFAVNEVDYTINTVVSTYHELANHVNVILNSIEVYTLKVVKWLEVLFSWTDILYVKKALVTAVTSIAHALPVTGPFISQIWKDNILTFDNSKASTGNATMNTETNKPVKRDDQADECNQHNIFLDGLNPSNEAYYQRSTLSRKAPKSTPALEEFVSYADTTYSTSSEVAAFTAFSKSGQTNSTDPRAMVNSVIPSDPSAKSICESLIQPAIDATVKSLDASTITSLIDGLLLEKIDLPVLSDLYRSIANDSLTLLDFFCLIAAIPLTLFYKLLNGNKPPFTADTYATFAQTFTKERVELHLMGLLTGSQSNASGLEHYSYFVALAGFIAGMIGSVVNAAYTYKKIITYDPNNPPKMSDLMKRCGLMFDVLKNTLWVPLSPTTKKTAIYITDSPTVNVVGWAVMTWWPMLDYMIVDAYQDWKAQNIDWLLKLLKTVVVGIVIPVVNFTHDSDFVLYIPSLLTGAEDAMEILARFVPKSVATPYCLVQGSLGIASAVLAWINYLAYPEVNFVILNWKHKFVLFRIDCF